MSEKVLIYGSSDDILCIEGGSFSDELYPEQDADEPDLLALSDGTLLRVVYDGCWRLTRLMQGSLPFEKAEALGEDGEDHPGGQPGYSDVVTLQGDVKWALLGRKLAKK